MKKLFFLLALASSACVHAQLVPNGNSGSSMTSYTNAAANDPIYIWCGNTLGAQQGSLTATPTNGTGPFTFNWYYHDQGSSSWQSFSVDAGVAVSTISNLASDGYRVEIVDASNTVVDCFVAWVWNLNTELTASSGLSNCNNASLSSTVNTTGSFTYFNTPPPRSLINANTQISVCFTANHTYVSDLAFYLIGPSSCGFPTILLSPNPGVLGQNNTCNGGDNVNNLCFTNTGGGNLDVCNPTPSSLSGTYSTYGPASTAIGWASLIGCNAAGGGFGVQIYDCVFADVGALTNATITFSNLTSVCGSPTIVSYNSGAINSVINDFSCTAASASIFQVPVPPILSTPITITATTTLLWTGPGIANPTSGNTTANGLPVGVSTFTLTATTSYGGTTCTPPSVSTSVDVVYPIVNAGPDQTVCKDELVTLSGSGAQTYSWDNGVTNGVPFAAVSTTTYTVIGTNSSGCTDTDEVLVTVNPLPSVNGGENRTVCEGTSLTLAGSGAASYTWSNGVQNNVGFIPPLGTNTYVVTGTSAAGCENTDTIVITVVLAPTAVLGSNSPLSGLPGLEVEFTNSSSDANTYNFEFGNGASFNTTNVAATPNTVYQTPGNYTVILTAGNGICEDTAHLTVVVVYNPLLITVPNIFTPNGDGNNDRFFIRLENAASLEVTIVNRWGNQMATYSGVNGYWDGKVNGNLADEGVYFFKYTATGLDGTVQTGQGDIQLIKD